MILGRITGTVVATQKNRHLENNRLLIVQPVELDTRKPVGNSMVALDKVDAGEGDLVLMIREGGSARIAFANPKIPLQAVVVAVVDHLEVADEAKLEWPKRSPQ